MSVLARGFKRLPLLGKLLFPFLSLLVLLGVLGAFLIVRDLTARAETALDQDILRRSLDAKAVVNARELYLLESANFASNLQGMAEGVRAGDQERINGLLQSVLALKTDLSVVAVVDRSGKPVSELFRTASGVAPRERDPTSWSSDGSVQQALQASKSGGLIRSGQQWLLIITAPICSGVTECSAVGAAIVGTDLDTILAEAVERPEPASPAAASSAIYDLEGRLLAATGGRPMAAAPTGEVSNGIVRRTSGTGSDQVATLYSRMLVQGKPIGFLSVTIPTAPAFESVRGAGLRLALIIFLAMLGITLVGAVVSRYIVGQIRLFLETNRALGAGDLSARVPVESDDELGELGLGLNRMAEQIEGSYQNLEVEVEERTEQVRRLLKERTDFFTALSHEFRTPLAVVLAQVDLLQDPSYPKTRSQSLDATETIREATSQVLDAINEILEIAKVEAGYLEVQLSDVQLFEVVGELRGTIDGLSRAAGLRAAITLPPDLPKVRADPGRLREILLNLVDNATKYTPTGGEITLFAAASNGTVEVCVSDTGVGIPDDVGDRVFEPFFRVPGNVAQRGQASSGLGLALTKRLVEAQGGEIGFKSVPGEGTVFKFTMQPSANHS